MTGRDFALILLDKKRLPGWERDLLKRQKTIAPTDSRDFALAEQISTGVVKNLLRLQRDIEHYCGKPLSAVDPVVQKILAIALYQLQFLDRIPVSAAVDQAVEQAKKFGHRNASGFVNAVLRNVGRQPPPGFPDAGTEPEEYAERVLSHPRELFRQVAAILGPGRAVEFCRHSNTEPPTILRLFKGVEITSLMRERDGLPGLPPVEIIPHEQPGLVVARGPRLGPIIAHWAERGLAQVQDATAAGVVAQLQIAAGQRVLDRCAGLGTKTIQIQELAGAAGEVVAIEPSAFRVAALRRTMKLRHISHIEVIAGSKIPEKLLPFDRILIDVPCSNSGVLARRPEARYRFEVDCLVKVQREILRDTLPRLAAGGLLVYSTCSIWPRENEEQIQSLVSQNPGLEMLYERTILPSFDETSPEKYHDGGYTAVLRKMK
jgi:16S rRNA (cytosine967-C5)-methyltransferase